VLLTYQAGSFDAEDLMHLRETGAKARHEDERKQTLEKRSYEELRSREADRESEARDAALRAAAAAAAGVRAVGPAAAPAARLLVRARPGQPAAKGRRLTEAAAGGGVEPAVLPPAPVSTALASLLGYSDSEED
jgi:hypothetical protein